MLGDEGLDRRHECCDRRFHVGGAASIKHAVADGRRERITRPVLERPGRYHVDVAGEADQRRLVPAPRPEVVHAVGAEALAAESERLQALFDELETAGVVRGDRVTLDQLAGQFESGGHAWKYVTVQELRILAERVK